MSVPPRIVFVAGDGSLEHALPFLAALRAGAAHLRPMLIPRDAATALIGFAEDYGFDVWDGDLAPFDHLEDICCGPGGAGGALRALAAFDVPGPLICLDPGVRAPALPDLIEPVAGADCPTIAVVAAAEAVFAPDAVRPLPAFSARLFALSATRPGGRAVVTALRERLVDYMTDRAHGAVLAPALNIAVAALGLRVEWLERALDVSPAAAPRIVALREAGGDVAMLDNGGAYERPPGRVFGAPATLVAARAAQLDRRVEPPPAMLARLRHATVFGRGIVMTVGGDVVRESLINRHPRGALDGVRDRAVTVRDTGGPLVLLMQTWDHNYGHWLIESLPRLGLVAERCDLAGCRFLIGPEDGTIGQVYRDSLALLGIGPRQIVASDDARFCADLIYPAPLTVQPWVKAPRVLAFLQNLAARVPETGTDTGAEPGPRRLYVSRNGVGRRALRNEDAILRRLEPRGYVAVEPQRLDLAGQVRMFRHATHVIGNLGAAMANLAFAPPGVRVLALTTAFMQDDFFWDLVSLLGGDYLSQHGRALDPAAAAQSDFEIEESDLEQRLDGFDGASAPQDRPHR